jgi:hypothetical protein
MTNTPKKIYIGQPVQQVLDPTTAPTLGQTANTASTLSAGTYYVVYTWKNANGETTISPRASFTTSAGNELNITVPAFPSGVTHAVIYVSTTSGSETKQVEITTTTHKLTADPIVGTAFPTVNSIYTNLYTVPSAKYVISTDLLMHNTTSADTIVNIYFVNSGGKRALSNQVISHTITAKNTIVLNLKGVLEVGDMIQAEQVTANAITLYLSGVEVG